MIEARIDEKKRIQARNEILGSGNIAGKITGHVNSRDDVPGGKIFDRLFF
jgi:hypothetical protein